MFVKSFQTEATLFFQKVILSSEIQLTGSTSSVLNNPYKVQITMYDKIV